MTIPKNQPAGLLMVGLYAGLVISQIWPHETIRGNTSDRSETFTIVTVPADNELGAIDNIFVLDFLTGRLIGASMNPQTGIFTQFYIRNIEPDFGVRPRSKPQYGIAAGRMPFALNGNTNAANGVLYISELSSGKVACYGYPFVNTNKPVAPTGIALLDIFSFREMSPVD